MDAGTNSSDITMKDDRNFVSVLITPKMLDLDHIFQYLGVCSKLKITFFLSLFKKISGTIGFVFPLPSEEEIN